MKPPWPLQQRSEGSSVHINAWHVQGSPETIQLPTHQISLSLSFSLPPIMIQ